MNVGFGTMTAANISGIIRGKVLQSMANPAIRRSPSERQAVITRE